MAVRTKKPARKAISRIALKPIWFRLSEAMRAAIEAVAQEEKRTFAEIAYTALEDRLIAAGRLPSRVEAGMQGKIQADKPQLTTADLPLFGRSSDVETGIQRGSPVKIPAECPFREVDDDAPASTGGLCCKRTYWPAGGDPLCRTIGDETEAYRLHVDPSFDPQCIIRIGRTATTATLEAGRIFYEAHRRELTDIEWIRFQEVLHQSGFWSAPSDVPTAGGFDGTTVTFEGRRGDEFHVVRRWPDAGELGAIEWLMMELAGLRGG